jgi:tripartite ATP-independent transporter DctM subunit
MILQFVLLLGLFILLSLPIAGVLSLLGFTLDWALSPLPLQLALGEIAWEHGKEFILVAVPLFILIGELLLLAGVADRMYNAILRWVSWAPGGLMHANTASCALFAATSGSSVATAATVGTVALPQMRRQGYNERLFLGSLAAGGTLGILIPPSINMVIYGALTDTSVPQLYLAGFIPGALLALLFAGVVMIACAIRPSFGGQPQSSTWAEKFASLPHLVPPILLFMVIVGSIYAGIATPTEAAALGVPAAMLLAWWNGAMSLSLLHRALANTMRTTAMIMLIMTAAYFLNFAIAAVGIVDTVNQFVVSLGWSPLQTLLAIIAIYIILGCIMDVLAMMVLTLPITTPLVVGLGYDPVWFGVVIMIVCEIALITPPIGMNCYVIQAVRGSGKIGDVFVGIVPFFLAMLLLIALLIAWPDVALWLPTMFYR